MTTIAISAFQVPDLQFGGVTSGFLRLYASREWLDSDGVVHIGGQVGGETGFYQACPFTVTDGTITVDSFETSSTSDAQDNAPSTILITGQLFDSSGQYLGTLFSQWQIPNATPTTFDALWNINRSRTLPIAPAFYITQQQMVDYVQSVLGSRNYASSVVAGIGYTDYDPLISNHPEFVGSNSPVVGRNSDDYASLSAAVSSIGSTPTTLVITNAFPSGATVVVPSTLTLKFVSGGSIALGSGHTVTIRSDTSRWPIAQLFSGTGTVSFSGNSASPYLYWQWWGAIGDNSADDTAEMQSTLDAAAGRPIFTTAAFRPKITATLTSTGPVTIIGEGVVNSSTTPEPCFNWHGAANGVMFSFTGTEYLLIRGVSVNMKAGSNSGATFAKWDTTGPESRITFDNIFIQNPAINANTKLFYSSPTSMANNENVAFRYVQAYASSDATTTGASRGYVFYQGVNSNAIDITFDHVWFTAATAAFHFGAGNNVAIRDSFITGSNIGIEAATDLTIENTRFETVGQYVKNLGGAQTWTLKKNFLDGFGLAAATPAFDFSAGTVALSISGTLSPNPVDPAQVWFSATGGASLFSENNGYPITSNLNITAFGNYWSYNDASFSAGRIITKLATGSEQILDLSSGLDSLFKLSTLGGSIKQRIGPSSNVVSHIYENYYLLAGATDAKDVQAWGGWDTSLGVSNTDSNSHWKIVYVPAGSLTPSAAFLDVDGTGLVSAPGAIKGGSVRGTAVAFASLPASPVEGMLVPITDSSTAVWGATITGGGANHVLAYFNGSAWTVSGK